MGVVAEAEKAQPEPSLAGDAANSTSREDTSESETEGKVGTGEIEEQEDLFESGSKDHGGDEGSWGKDDAPADMADQQEEYIFVFLDEE